MAKEDLTLVRLVELGVRGKDVVAVKRMIARAGVGFTPVKEKGKILDIFGQDLDDAVRLFQRQNNLVDDGQVGYITLKALLKHAGPFESKLLREFVKERLGDWGILGLNSAFAGIDMGADFLGAGPIPMFADGVIVRVVHTGSGWPGIGGLIVVQCDKGPMARHPIYTSEDIRIPASHIVGKRLMKGELLAEATGTREAPGIEIGWAGGAPNFRGTLFQELHGQYTSSPRATAEGIDFWKTLSVWMAKGV